MIESDKREFKEMMDELLKLPFLKAPDAKEMPKEMLRMYWAALQHRSIDDIRSALNKHIQDAERGRFFPLPADISAQLPRATELWPDANEAWAMCPKDENTSAAMCEEMASAYSICQDLVDYGDMVAARMAFISAYKRNVEMAIAEGKAPKWYPSYGEDKHLRHYADREIVRMKNMSLPPAERIRLPDMRSDDVISLEQLSEKAPIDSENAKQNIKSILGKLKAGGIEQFCIDE